MKKINNKKFFALSKANQKKVIEALETGRAYLTERVNGSEFVGGLHYCLAHNGKMRNVISLSTSVVDNPICQKRMAVEDSICSHCFASAQMKIYSNMRPVYAHNLEILRTRLLNENEIPVILSNSGLFRVESFGDVCSTIQAANYLRICAANPWLECAAWTKNPHFYLSAIQSGMATKPANLRLVLSSEGVNRSRTILPAHENLFDYVFTVYDKQGAESVTINCGARSCATCRRCYTAGHDVNVNEKLK